MLRIDFAPLQKRIHEATNRATVGNGTVVFLALFLGAALLTALLAAWFALGNREALLGGAAIFCVVLGARLLVLHLFSQPVPFWDEWEGDVLYILIPFAGGFLDWGALVMPQWEHRILLTRVITLFGTILNGEWDPRVAMTVSAGMFSATIAIIGTALIATRRFIGAMAAALLAGCAALPYDFNNLLWGGQTQMYGLVLLTVCTIGVAAAPRVTPMILMGALAGSLMALVTMGAGPVAAGCGLGICLVRIWFEKEERHALVRLAAIFFAVALLGVYLHVSSRAHVPLYATTVRQFLRAFIGVLAWPLPPLVMPWTVLAWLMGAALIWTPWLVNGLLILRRREATPLEWLAVGLGTWGIINAIALGYARQYEGPPFDSRFFTSITIGQWGSLCASVALAIRASASKWRAGALVACCAVLVGLTYMGIEGIWGARANGAERTELTRRVTTFLSTGNRTPVVEKPSHHIDYGHDVANRLESPLLREVLPASFRKVLTTSGPKEAQRDGAGPITMTVRALMRAGIVIVVLGLIGCGYVVWRARATRPTLLHVPG